MKKSVFHIPLMDCPSEENVIRLKLSEINDVKRLQFDLEKRKLTVYHLGDAEAIERPIIALDMGGRLERTEEAEIPAPDSGADERKLLWAVLSINFTFFVIEMATGLWSGSMGLVADSLDMLADASVYGLSLHAVGSTLVRKKRVARFAGYFQATLAIIGFSEVMRRFIGVETIPDHRTMIYVSVLALVANAACLLLLQRTKSQEVHIKASMIFTSNDVIINLGVIVAGLMVMWLGSNIPDLVIGSVVFLLVTRGALRILRLGK